MAKEKPIKKTSVKEPVVKEQKIVTLKEKIDGVVEKYGDKEELKKQIFGLIQRVLYPDQFCPECNDRLFFNPTGWSCSNCGYQQQTTPKTTTQPTTRPSQGGKVPPQVEKMIQSAEEPRRVSAPTKKGQSIRKLVDQLDTGGPVAPTQQDEAMVRRDRNVGREVNWV